MIFRTLVCIEFNAINALNCNFEHNFYALTHYLLDKYSINTIYCVFDLFSNTRQTELKF
jgi:hypothetical protein